MDNDGLIKRNFDKPVIKDTVTVPVGGKFMFLLKQAFFV